MAKKTLSRWALLRAAVVLGLGAAVVGCATHSALKDYLNAKDRLQLAKKVNPSAPELLEADEALGLGKRQMDEARYDQAIRSFRLSMRSSDDAIQKSLETEKVASQISPPPSNANNNNASVSAAPSPKPLENTASVAAPPAAGAAVVIPQEIKPSALAPEEKRQVEMIKEKVEKRSLPSTALQKYLAQKKHGASTGTTGGGMAGVTVPATPAPKEAPKKEEAVKNAAPKAAAEPAPQAQQQQQSQPQEVAKIENPDAPAEELQEEVNKAEAEAPVEAGDPKGQLAKSNGSKAVVGAPDKPKNMQVPPGGAGKSTPPPPKVIEAPAPSASSGPVVAAPKMKNKKRIPGTVTFFLNDPSIQPDMMAVLDQTSKYLLDNPSISLVLQGNLGPTEANTMIDARYESLRSYLVGKGVPEDQIQLDTERKRAKSPDFLFFEIEH